MAHIHKPLVVAVGLNTAIFAAEAAGGVRAQSLSLLGDAAHNFSDELLSDLLHAGTRKVFAGPNKPATDLLMQP